MQSWIALAEGGGSILWMFWRGWALWQSMLFFQNCLAFEKTGVPYLLGTCCRAGSELG